MKCALSKDYILVVQIIDLKSLRWHTKLCNFVMSIEIVQLTSSFICLAYKDMNDVSASNVLGTWEFVFRIMHHAHF